MCQRLVVTAESLTGDEHAVINGLIRWKDHRMLKQADTDMAPASTEAEAKAPAEQTEKPSTTEETEGRSNDESLVAGPSDAKLDSETCEAHESQDQNSNTSLN